MNPLKLLRRLRRRLAKSPAAEAEPKQEKFQEDEESKPPVAVVPPPPPKSPILDERDPYLVQIGLDFGTAFSKCVCRDILAEKAWIHTQENNGSEGLPFLIPCNLAFENGYLWLSSQGNGSYLAGGLSHVKMALQKAALEEWDDPFLRPFKKACGEVEIPEFVKACAVYLIAGILGGVKREISRRFPGHQEKDSALVNMAVPVADADRPVVEALFEEVLRQAWILAEKLTGHPKVKVAYVISLMREYASEAAKEDVGEACYLYPEASANVQGFVRSRVSSPGIYLFSDAGAGTVNQSLFIFKRKEGEDDKLTFLNAAVLPLGSSHIERLALDHAGEEGLENLEKWRLRKERNEKFDPLRRARQDIGKRLGPKTKQTIAIAKQKLPSWRQINELKMILGGGGLCDIPYKKSVLEQFNSVIFSDREISKRRHEEDLVPIGLPTPTDLTGKGIARNGMNRLSVAYGLSFHKDELAQFKLPGETPKATVIWRPRAQTYRAASKDDC